MKNTTLVQTPVQTVPVAQADLSLDRLTTSIPTWNNTNPENIAPITLRDPARCVLASFEYLPEKLVTENGNKTPFSILRCSDNNAIVGVPFNPRTYKLLNNDKFLTVIEAIGTQLDKLGVKWTVATTGTLNERGRLFVGLKLDGFDAYKVGGREILMFLNALNSVDKSCNWVFANNAFTVCCKNTFRHCLESGESASLHVRGKHSSGMDTALLDIPKIVEMFITGNEKILKTLKAFHAFPIGLTDAEEIFAAWLGNTPTTAEGIAKFELPKLPLSTRTANMIDRLTALFAKGKGNNGETALDLFNAATEYYTHESAGKSDNAMKQFSSSEDLNGDGAKAKSDFYNVLIKLLDGKQGADYRAFGKCGNMLLVQYRSKPTK